MKIELKRLGKEEMGGKLVDREGERLRREGERKGVLVRNT